MRSCEIGSVDQNNMDDSTMKCAVLHSMKKQNPKHLAHPLAMEHFRVE